MRLNPIFKPDMEEKIEMLLEETYKTIVGYQKRDMLYLPTFKPKFKGLAHWLCNLSSEKKGLIIGGSVGIGKTTFLKSIKNVLQHYYPTRVFLLYANLIGDIYKNRDNYETWDLINGNIKTCGRPVAEYLLIDDLGMEEDMFNDYGTKTQPMAVLLHNRADKGLTTIVTTNFSSLEALRQKYDDRIIDRLNAYAKMFYEFKSFRQ